jgi:hypothetical protein
LRIAFSANNSTKRVASCSLLAFIPSILCSPMMPAHTCQTQAGRSKRPTTCSLSLISPAGRED